MDPEETPQTRPIPGSRRRPIGWLAALLVAGALAVVGVVGTASAASPSAIPSAGTSADDGSNDGAGAREDCPEKAADEDASAS